MTTPHRLLSYIFFMKYTFSNICTSQINFSMTTQYYYGQYLTDWYAKFFRIYIQFLEKLINFHIHMSWDHMKQRYSTDVDKRIELVKKHGLIGKGWFSKPHGILGSHYMILWRVTSFYHHPWATGCFTTPNHVLLHQFLQISISSNFL